MATKMLKIIFPFLMLPLIQMNQSGVQKDVTINTVEIKTDATDDENIQEGSNITLTCSANIIIPPDQRSQILHLFYKGEKKDILLQNASSNGLSSKYILQSARASHSGYYSCVVEAGSKRKESDTTFITVKGNLQTPRLTIHPMNVTLGDSIELCCTSEEIPPLTFIFYKYKDGQKPQRFSDVKSNNKSAMHQLKVAVNTEKAYSCKVEVNGISAHSENSQMVQITVRDPFPDPIIKIEPSKGIFEGDNLTIKCVVHFILFPDIQPEITIVKDITSIATNATVAVFTKKATANDTGEYKCMAQWNDALKITKRHVIVKVPVSEPTLKSTPTGDNVVAGETLNLSCAVLKGTYPITYNFYKATSEAPLHQITLNATEAVHRIISVNIENQGRYSCEASNTANQINRTERSQYVNISVKDTSWWLYITVLVPLVLIATAAVLAFGLRRQCKNNKDIRQADESDEIRQREPSQNNQGSLKESMEVVYSKIGKIIRPKLNQVDCDTLIEQPGTDSDWNHEGDYTNIVLPKGNGIDPESDCEGDYTNVTSKRKAANADSDSCSDESDGVHYIQIDLAALQTQNMSQPEGPTIYASIALNKLR
ncbi:platelet endothelial cell adhesion molecule isoform X5 [Mustelus asterias]